ncbi:hypothetical protein M407DRAFT_156658 [Tulasnella calospora MUT 4182]|uniref:Small ribosomal subunit protein bS18m n=1 Tax=Tulasnella calospora MUT 4182 TaxID=1051891 RepID=A0A0C3QFJ2_9AGAM|nr:hypothetical protein M407DRAFT_156658 [Tulasnella calospora MUT 4182]
MLSLLRTARVTPARFAARYVATKAEVKTPSVVDIVSDAMLDETATPSEELSPSGTDFSAPAVRYKAWTKGRPVRVAAPSEFYSPNDFLRDRRVVTPRALSEIHRPSGLGPSAGRSKLRDPFHILGLNPAKEFRNSRLMSDFVTDMGMIKNRGATGLTRKNQRMVAKAIKRARNMGILPMFSKAQVTN